MLSWGKTQPLKPEFEYDSAFSMKRLIDITSPILSSLESSSCLEAFCRFRDVAAESSLPDTPPDVADVPATSAAPDRVASGWRFSGTLRLYFLS